MPSFLQLFTLLVAVAMPFISSIDCARFPFTTYRGLYAGSPSNYDPTYSGSGYLQEYPAIANTGVNGYQNLPPFYPIFGGC